MELNYRLYHIDAKGGTKGLHNFAATNDTLACEQAGVFMAESEWPGIELWERMRQVHCRGVARLSAGMPEFPPSEIAA